MTECVFIAGFNITQALPVIKGLLDKLRSSVKELEGGGDTSEGESSSDGIRQHYENTLAHVIHTKANDSSMYPDIEV